MINASIFKKKYRKIYDKYRIIHIVRQKMTNIIFLSLITIILLVYNCWDISDILLIC